MPKSNNKSNTSQLLRVGAIGVALAIVTTIILSVIGAIFIQNEYLEMSAINIVAFAIQFTAAFAGALVAGKFKKSNALMSCGLAGGVYFLLLIVIGVLFCDGVGSDILLSLLTVFLGTGAAFLLCTRGKNRTFKKKRRRKNR